ncbi:unnamed protein product [Toxocara canis]|uniref:Uncharacterized protein n=1 Tax=Toxocara canis TaxID=6265 RepID=A0A183VFV1_TOXCA|nr:unnamed protein product [Toxocara canis]
MLLMSYAGVHSQLQVPQTSILYATCSWYPRRVSSMQVAYGTRGCAFAAIGVPDELPVNEVGVSGCTFAATGTPDELPVRKLLMVYAGFIRSYRYPRRVTYMQVAYAIGSPDELPVRKLLWYTQVFIRGYRYPRRVTCKEVAYGICGCSFTAIGTPDELTLSELGMCGCTFAATGTPDELPVRKLLMVYAGFIRSYRYPRRVTYMQVAYGICGCPFATTGTPDELPIRKLLMVYAGVHSRLQVPQTSYL